MTVTQRNRFIYLTSGTAIVSDAILKANAMPDKEEQEILFDPKPNRKIACKQCIEKSASVTATHTGADNIRSGPRLSKLGTHWSSIPKTRTMASQVAFNLVCMQ